jgi:heme-degrading monooxygenase HmoA
MSVLAIFRWRGDPTSLLASVDKELEHSVARDRPRRQLHVRAGTEDGMVIVDLWDSREDFEEMMNDPEFQENLKRAGTPDPDSLEVYEVHATVP